MKLKITIGTLRGLRAVRFVAVINPSKKLGIPKRFQKTFTLKTVAPEATAKEQEFSATQEAKRWESKVMEKIKQKNEKEDYWAASKESLNKTAALL